MKSFIFTLIFLISFFSLTYAQECIIIDKSGNIHKDINLIKHKKGIIVCQETKGGTIYGSRLPSLKFVPLEFSKRKRSIMRYDLQKLLKIDPTISLYIFN